MSAGRRLRRRALLAAILLGAAIASGSAEPGDEPAHTRDISKVAKRGAVVLDKNCPSVVQPYSLNDNAASLALFAAKEATVELAEKAGSIVKSLMSRGSAPTTVAVGADVGTMRSAAKQLNWLPMPAEVAYGQELHAKQTDLLDRDSRVGKRAYPGADQMLEQVVRAIGEPTDYRFQLFIVKNSTANAVARPGGFIYLDQGLLDDPAKRPKAYFALAHEVAHVLQRHETKELQNYAIDSISINDDVKKLMRNAQTDPQVLLAKAKLEKNQFTRHHIDQELQADSCAARLLSVALPGPDAVAQSLDAFIRDLPANEEPVPSKRSVNDPGAIGDAMDDIVNSPIARHPSSRERTANLRAMASELGATRPKAKP